MNDDEVAERLLESLERIAESLEIISFYLESQMTDSKTIPPKQTH